VVPHAGVPSGRAPVQTGGLLADDGGRADSAAMLARGRRAG
jgi:hypothetical protein